MMAKTKVYFWLKVDKKFFDNLFIKRLKHMPGGYTMTVIYIRLMLESLEDDCILYYEGYFDNLVQELALKLDVSEDDINMTVAYFTKCGLIQIDDDGHATLSQAKAMVESETNWAKYKREQRKNSQNLPKLENVQNKKTISNSCPTEIEIELEKDIEIEKEIHSSAKSTTTKRKRFEKPTLSQITQYCLERNNNVNAEQFYDYYESNGWKVGKNSMKDWKACVRTWERNGYDRPIKKKNNKQDTLNDMRDLMNEYGGVNEQSNEPSTEDTGSTIDIEYRVEH